MSKTVSELLNGLVGLEIGRSSWNSFNINAKNVDISNRGMWEDYAKRIGREPAVVDIEADASSIPVESCSQDFVFSSHMFEHHPNPVAVMIEWHRVLKDDGLMVAIIPKRNASPDDVGKPLTVLSELVHRWNDPETFITNDPATHQTIWSVESFCEMIAFGTGHNLWSFEIVKTMETDDQVGNGFLVAFRKR